MRLRLEIALARLVGRVARLAGRGGTTLPGKVLTSLDAGAVAKLAARLPLGSALVSGTNGKTTTAGMVAEIVGRHVRLAHNRAGANLVSGVASTLLASPDAELGLFEVDEFAFPEVSARVRPAAVSLGNLFRDQLDRYGELEAIAARWREAVGALPESTALVANADDPALAGLARGRDRGLCFGLDDPSVGRAHLPHAADSKYCVACGAPYVYEVSYVGHLGDWRCPSCGLARPPLDVAARAVTLEGLDGLSFDLAAPTGTIRVQLALPGLYNVYNALAAAGLAIALGTPLDEIAAGLSRFRPAFGRFERITIGERTVIVLLVKNPAGANEALRTLLEGEPPAVAVLALNDEIADGRDVSWIWDVDYESLAARLDRLVATGARAQELALRFKYGGLPEDRIEVVPDIAAALDRGLELVPPGASLPVLPTYTAMLRLRRVAAARGHVRHFLEAA
jgi:UDP-N-acetylmuramyl tripeptide synthase